MQMQTTAEIEIPEEVTVTQEGDKLVFEGPNGRVEREFTYPGVKIDVENGSVSIKVQSDRRRLTATAGTFESHIENAIHGVTEGWEYKMKVVYAHFPMQVEVKGDEVEVRNFIGEKHPRRTKIIGDTQVEVSGEDITLTGPNKEHVGQTAANIEHLTRVTDRDIRVFQDGIYITKKPKV